MTYSVEVEANGGSRYQATVLGWPNCSGVGATREEALERLRRPVQKRLKRAELVQLEIDVLGEHPLSAGSLKDNPLFDAVLDDIQAYRRELDADEEAF